MKVIKEPLPGLLVIQPDVYEDDRGFFLETWQQQRYKNIGIEEEFVQDNWSRSTKGVLRGLHFQKKYPQGKLVSVRQGKVFDVAVDIRPESETFGKWYGNELSDQNHLQMYIPPGFAHGFCVLSKVADFNYKCTEFYHSNDEGGIVWNDSNLDIKWPIENPIVSNKDKQLGTFKAYQCY
ncbi:dTDP-4-dehydrorhamnose 3,5-epimerase [Fodinibius salsisoli]|uniref:dTDP-4-dehydrorhamnose 3,5-epimerase n=1 Tax=Fodinibius salsisoli TaxID=2820877 RepID=A0ABT3PTG0_9BACT|nr:dTDP-4-dehydrorhamnose 3,5-epimerase [Fodinibius salsisoli]MCW9709140.1 dTDP-4-dehydrorhamnose 3,5-epimerase [Fodinibius salsisoli]